MSGPGEKQSEHQQEHTPVPPPKVLGHVDAHQPPLFVFGTPDIGRYGLSLCLHRRGNRWYIVWGRGYGMAVNRWVASLNSPRRSDPPTTAPPKGLEHLNHRFWFNPTQDPEKLLQDLLAADKPVIKLTGNSRREKWAGDPTGRTEIDAKQVEVLVPDDQLSRRCAFCGSWENTGDPRWCKVEDGEDPVYWCSACDRNKSLWSKISDLFTSIPDDRYF
ncbi:hypothetical protein GLOTRDRAFT_138232 [Gloeophyllum trabeum ATCC 11539]|uniref:Uncharacterized protein n=1 Tax=Gloeophyllum trabeum (strain ATCC 11539 / FP-39264 / Madison 617) TaxID=670483 RepID=S7QB24_GLOTA|nr:uncharacterized protein GLOTRDRAFT_138232 [Gloeophyllum trabeum ATCC 11539]EPQ56522.1 hypothetical protein GLOTRDRAFT_138232 [Gloeophyllum trabeum ATCC 11539]